MQRRSSVDPWKICLLSLVLLSGMATRAVEARTPVTPPTPQAEAGVPPQETLAPGADGTIHVKTADLTITLDVQPGPDPSVAIRSPGLGALLTFLSTTWREEPQLKRGTFYSPSHYVRWGFGASEGTVDGRPASWPEALTMSGGEARVSLRALAQFLSFRLVSTPTAGTYTLVPLVEKLEIRRDGGDRRLVVVASAPVEPSASTRDGRLRLVVPGARWGFASRVVQVEDVTITCEGSGTPDDPVALEVLAPPFWRCMSSSQFLPTEIPVRLLPGYAVQPDQPEQGLEGMSCVRSNGETFLFAEFSGSVRHFWQYDPQARQLLIEIPQVRMGRPLPPLASSPDLVSVRTETSTLSQMNVIRLRLQLAANNGFEVRMVPEGTMARLVVRVASQSVLPVGVLQGGDPLIPDGVGRGVIVIDPGHGGGDPGAVNRTMGLQEKNITLDICLRLKEVLVRRGWTVRLTRESDRDVSWAHSPDRVELGMRAALAKEARADLFISVHCNASVSAAMNGTTYHWFKPEDLNLARSLLGALSQGTGIVDHGLVRNRFFVLRHTNVPAVLVETAFISNATDASRLADALVRQRIADNLAEALSLHMAREAAQRGSATTGR